MVLQDEIGGALKMMMKEVKIPFLTVVVVAALLPVWVLAAAKQHHQKGGEKKKLRFGSDGQFKILQVADMHYANGKTTPCLDVLPSQFPTCSDLNTTAFLHRMIQAEKPNLIVFTGIYSLFSFPLFLMFIFNFIIPNFTAHQIITQPISGIMPIGWAVLLSDGQ